MPGLNDWIDIFERHVASDGCVTLSPSEVVRLRYDLAKACKVIADGQALLEKQQIALGQAMALAARHGWAYDKAMKLASRFAAFSGNEVFAGALDRFDSYVGEVP